MKYLRYWEDIYSIHHQLRRFKGGFLEKYGQESYISLRGDDCTLEQVQQAVMGWGMFSTKKLIVVRGIPGDNHPDNKLSAKEQTNITERIIKARDMIPQDHIVILISYKPDKRLKTVKRIIEHTDAKEFSPKDPKQMAQTLVDLYPTDLDHNLALHLVDRVGVHRGMMAMVPELEKLVSYAHATERPISKDMIQTICTYHEELDAFKLSDLIFLDKQATYLELQKIQDSWEDAIAVIARILRSIELILKVQAVYDTGITKATDISKEIKTHHFPIMKKLKYLDQYRQQYDHIVDTLMQLNHLDYRIKTGTIEPEAVWLALIQIVV